MARYNSINLFRIAPLLILLMACSETEEIIIPAENKIDSDEVKCELSINLPEGMSTRGTPGDAESPIIDCLYWAVFEVQTNADGEVVESRHIADFNKNAFGSGNQSSERIVLTLPKNKKYQVAMMAKLRSSSFTSFQKGVLTVNYNINKSLGAFSGEILNNDVFVGRSEIIDAATGFFGSVTLRRPFAQINWGSSDLKSKIVGIVYGKGYLKNMSTYDSATNSVYQKLDILSNEVSNPVTSDISVTYNDIPSPSYTDKYTFPSANGILNYLFHSVYLLVDQNSKTTINCKMKFSSAVDVEVEVNNAPVQANYRTNIYGALLTDPNFFNIDLNEGFISADNGMANVENKDIIDKIMAGEDVEIPEGVIVDITDYGRPQLRSGQTITVNGTLRVNTKQLYMSGSGKTLIINGTGTIVCTATNASQVIYADNGAMIRVKDVTVFSVRSGSGTTVYSYRGGSLDLENVTVHTGSWGIVCDGKGTLNAVGCKVYFSGNADPKMIGVQNGAAAYLKDCETYSDIHSMYIKDAEAVLDNCRFNIKKRDGMDASNVLVEGTSKLTILSGYYKSVGTHTIYRFAKKDEETEESVVFDIRGGHFSRPFGSENGWVAVNPAPGYKLVSNDDPEFPLEVVPE